MIPLFAQPSQLTWLTLPRNQGYELTMNDVAMGTLRRPSIWSTSFVASTRHGTWIFRRAGLLGTSTEIVDSASQHQIARFKSTWTGRGTLTFADGQAFHAECHGLWRPVWKVTTETGQPVLFVHAREKTGKAPGRSLVPEDRLSLLILLVLYRLRQAEEDDSTGAVVAATSSS